MGSMTTLSEVQLSAPPILPRTREGEGGSVTGLTSSETQGSHAGWSEHELQAGRVMGGSDTQGL